MLKVLLISILVSFPFLPLVSSTMDIQPPHPPVADFFWTPEDPEVGEQITFNASPSWAFHDSKIVSYEWDLNQDEKCDDACGVITTCCHKIQEVYEVTLKVTDDHGRVGERTKTIDFRNPPDIPTITGNPSVKFREPYTCNIMTIDPDQDNVYYKIYWGGQTTEWLGPFESGVTITQEHTFDYQGNITIKVKAKDSTEAESNLGFLTITITKNKAVNWSFLKLLEQHLSLFQLLQILLSI